LKEISGDNQAILKLQFFLSDVHSLCNKTILFQRILTKMLMDIIINRRPHSKYPEIFKNKLIIFIGLTSN
jgi:hypothetical protein